MGDLDTVPHTLHGLNVSCHLGPVSFGMHVGPVTLVIQSHITQAWSFYGSIRWAQTAGFGYAPNPAMPNVFMAVLIDNVGGPHTPLKAVQGARLARGALRFAYGRSAVATSPRFVAATRGAGETLTMSFESDAALELRNRSGFGFEVLVPGDGGVASAAASVGHSRWQNAPIAAVHGKTVTIETVPTTATRLRYLWYNSPCGATPYGCPVYTPAEPIGTESGEKTFLPLGPFITDLPPSH